MEDNWREFFDKHESKNIALCSRYDSYLLSIEELYLNFKARYEAEKANPTAEKPVVDWAAMPAWFNWAAMDKSGDWYCHITKPDNEVDLWTSLSELRIPEQFSPQFSGDWKDSLVERPK